MSRETGNNIYEDIQYILKIKECQYVYCELKKIGVCYIGHRTHKDP